MTRSPVHDYLRRLLDEYRELDEGEVATYIPELGRADPNWFGICVVTADGHIYEVGDTDLDFTIQSISKPFVFGMALEDQGRDAVLRRVGLRISEREIVAPSTLARRLILESGRSRAALLVPPACRVDFEGIVETEEPPDWAVVGDLGREFTWERLNRAFSWLRAGAKLLALHKNRSWHAGRELGLVLDAGPFVAALEYASGTVAQVVGKPSPEFFHLALAELGVPPSRVLVVGDDPENDCAGGQRVGCRGAVVHTGKFDAAALARRPIAPDLILDSVAALDPADVNP